MSSARTYVNNRYHTHINGLKLLYTSPLRAHTHRKSNGIFVRFSSYLLKLMICVSFMVESDEWERYEVSSYIMPKEKPEAMPKPE